MAALMSRMVEQREGHVSRWCKRNETVGRGSKKKKAPRCADQDASLASSFNRTACISRKANQWLIQIFSVGERLQSSIQLLLLFKCFSQNDDDEN